MTLGLTSSGAVKIKTDGGLRAVNCACCGVCDCDVVRSTATPELIELLQNATGATLNGIAAGSFDFYSNDPETNPDWPISWQASWCFNIDDCSKHFLYAQWNGWETDPTSDSYKCFIMFGVRDSDPPQMIDDFPVFRTLKLGTSSCPSTYPTWVNSDTEYFTINGETFPCYQSYNPAAPLQPLDIPNLVFT
jgi:hypothetical protein